MAKLNQKDMNHYDILKIPQDASDQQIRDAYITMARIYHPDHNPQNKHVASDRLKKIKDAYEALKNDTIRIPSAQQSSRGF